MATPRNRRAPSFNNRPRWQTAPPPLQPNKEILAKLADAFGGITGLVKKIHQFVQVRERVTGWRVVSDAASRDRFHISESDKKIKDREELPVPMPAMTAYLAAESGFGDELSREAVLAALKALAEEPEAAKAGLSIRESVNAYVPEPYSTVSVAVRGGATLTPAQKALFNDE
jgi:hypothetical protein